ncbi:hypothetical protein VNO77_35948 [Canavalia gladiata]|uniref:Uncharacterized protein n=1 Tax=Canavalia gladiata TaxID=3824 RepID=A0AAN9PXE7_CANGL
MLVSYCRPKNICYSHELRKYLLKHFPNPDYLHLAPDFFWVLYKEPHEYTQVQIWFCASCHKTYEALSSSTFVTGDLRSCVPSNLDLGFIIKVYNEKMTCETDEVVKFVFLFSF